MTNHGLVVDNDGDGYANAGEAFRTTRLNGQTRTETDLTAITLSPRVETIRTATIPTCSHQTAPQCGDRDGDGYGDNPSGENGDWFPDDPTQWWDEDGDGFGDNPDGNNYDICPMMYGTTNTDEARGCPDSDQDGTPDPQDAFPDDPSKTRHRWRWIWR